MKVHSVRPAQRDGDAGIVLDAVGRTALSNGMRVDAHRFPQAFDFGVFDLNPSLPPSAPLEIIDGEKLATEHELTGVGTGKPIVKTGHRNSETLSGGLAGKKRFGHDLTADQDFIPIRRST